jgi:hypothetical protein
VPGAWPVTQLPGDVQVGEVMPGLASSGPCYRMVEMTVGMIR